MAAWKWTRRRHRAAELLAEGYTVNEVRNELKVGERSIYRWLTDSTFQTEVELLTLTTGIASKAERLKIAKRVVRQRTKGDEIETRKDLLEWLEYTKSETGAETGSQHVHIDNLEEIAELIYGTQQRNDEDNPQSSE